MFVDMYIAISSIFIHSGDLKMCTLGFVSNSAFGELILTCAVVSPSLELCFACRPDSVLHGVLVLGDGIMILR